MKMSAFMIGFAGLKGGVGKSTLCASVATHLWYKYPELKPAIWDLDNQQSLYERRSEDEAIIRVLPENKKEWKEMKEMYRNQLAKCPLYTLRAYNPPDKDELSNMTKEQYHEMLANSDIPVMSLEEMYEIDSKTNDIIFVDFPGSVNFTDDIAKLISRMDALIVPITTSRKDLAAQKTYVDQFSYMAEVNDLPFKDNIHIVWNKIQPAYYRKKAGELPEDTVTRFYETLNQHISLHEIKQPTFETIIPHSTKLEDDTFQTILPVDSGKKKGDFRPIIDALVDEIVQKVIK